MKKKTEKKLLKNMAGEKELKRLMNKGKTIVKDVAMNELCMIKGNTDWKMKEARKFYSPQLRDDLKYLIKVAADGVNIKKGISYGFFKKHGFKIRAICAEPRHFKAYKVKGEEIFGVDNRKSLESVQPELMEKLTTIDGKPAVMRTGKWLGGTYNTGTKLIIINKAGDLIALQNALLREARERGRIKWMQIGKLILEHIETGTLICNQLDKAKKTGAGQAGYQLFCTHIVKNGQWFKCDSVKFQEELRFMIDYTVYEGVCTKEEQKQTSTVCACSGMIPPKDIDKIK